MLKYVLRRILYGVLLGVAGTVITFALLVGTGDPVDRVLSRPGVPVGTAQRVTAELHLEEAVPGRFAAWLGDVARGDFGTSVESREGVADVLVAALPRSAALVVVAALASIAVALVLGTFGAERAGRFPDGVLRAVFAVGICVPVVGWTLLIAGNATAGLPLATAALTISGGAALAIWQRRAASEILTSRAALTARARGLSQTRIVWHHALHASTAPLLRKAALGAGILVGAVVVVEPVAGVEGVGTALRTALAAADVPVVIGCVLVLVWLGVVLEVALDICAGWFDPMLRSGAAATTDAITIVREGRFANRGRAAIQVRAGAGLLGLVAGACLATHLLPDDVAHTPVGEALAAGVPELLLVAAVLVTAAPLGFLVGAGAARGGRVSHGVTRVGAYMLSTLPLIAIVLAAESRTFRIAGSAPGVLALAAALAWIPVARRTERSVRSALTTGHARSALAAGASRAHVLRGHVVPAAGRDTLATTLVTAVAALVVASCIGFVETSTSWGGLLGEHAGTPAGDLVGDLSFWAPLLLLTITTGALLLTASGLAATRHSRTPPGRVAASPDVPRPGEVLALIGVSRAEALELARGSVLLDPSPAALRAGTPIGKQLAETLARAGTCPKADAAARVRASLVELDEPEPDATLASLPSSLSSRTVARVVLAAALAADTGHVWVLADAPELGVRATNDLLATLLSLRNPRTSVTIVTADVGTAARHADRVAVFEADHVVESGAVDDVLQRPASPFTAALVAAAPDLARDLRPYGPAPAATPVFPSTCPHTIGAPHESAVSGRT